MIRLICELRCSRALIVQVKIIEFKNNGREKFVFRTLKWSTLPLILHHVHTPFVELNKNEIETSFDWHRYKLIINFFIYKSK